MSRPIVSVLFVLLPILLFSEFGASQQFDQTMAWPLCGRINEAPPAGWLESDGCPTERWGDPNFDDLPIVSVRSASAGVGR